MQGVRSALERVFACSPEAAEHLGQVGGERRWQAGAEIVGQGEPCRETFVLLHGRARARLHGADGQETLIQDFAAGDLFGCIGPLDPELYDAEVVALEPCTAAVFSAAEFQRSMEAHAGLGVAVSRILLRQLRASSHRLVERTSLSAAGRVHATLLRLAGEGRRIEPWPSPTALAPAVQSTRETVSRTLHALERRGIIRRDAAALVIVAPRRLEEMVI